MKSLKNSKKTIYFLLSFISIFLVSAFVIKLTFINKINDLYLDGIQGQIPARDEVVIIGIDDKSLASIGSWPWNREVFSKAIDNVLKDDPIVIGIDVLFLEEREGDSALRSTLETSSSKIVLGSKLIDGDNINNVYNDLEKVENGFVNFRQDSDGKIRGTFTSTKIDGECVKSLSLNIVQEYFKIKDDNRICGDEINLRNSQFKTDANGELRFSYTKEKFTKISFVDVYNGDYEPGFFKDKVILIGSTALDVRSNLNDNFTNIFGENVPGVEIHANIVNSFLNETFYTELNSLTLVGIIIVLLILLTSIYSKIKSIFLDLILFIVVLIANFIIGLFIIDLNILWPFVQLLIIISFHFLVVVIIRYILKNSENKYIKTAFSKYMNENLLNNLMSDPSKLRLGGETREMTVLFSDIRSFTTISEGLSPSELVDLVNNYLGYMSNIILKNDGTIDKYIGDAIMAFWNAPLTELSHASKAVLTTLEMVEKLKLFNEKYKNYPDLKVGIGLNTGEMIVGNVGGRKRFDYTVLGDNVNTGSRLESLTKYYGVDIIVSEKTVEQSSNLENVIFRLIDIVKVKGKKVAIKIYEPRYKSVENDLLFKKFQEAFSLYLEGDFKEAIESFKALQSDNVSNMMIERIEGLISDSVMKKDWEGVWEWDKK